MGKDAGSESNAEGSKAENQKSKKEKKAAKANSDSGFTSGSENAGASKPGSKAGSKVTSDASGSTKSTNEKGPKAASESDSKAGSEVPGSSKGDKGSKADPNSVGASKSDKSSKAGSEPGGGSKVTDRGSKAESEVIGGSKATDKGSKAGSDVSGSSKASKKSSKASSDASGQTKATDKSSKASSKNGLKASGYSKAKSLTGSEVKSSRVELDASSSKFLNAKSVSKVSWNSKTEKGSQASETSLVKSSEKKSHKTSKGKTSSGITEDGEAEKEKKRHTKEKTKSGKNRFPNEEGLDDKKSSKSKKSKKDKSSRGHDDSGNKSSTFQDNSFKSMQSNKKSHKSNTHKRESLPVSQTSTKVNCDSSGSNIGAGKSSIVKITPKDKHGKVDFSGCRIGFIGAGKMTEAISRGLVVYGKVAISKLFVGSKSVKNLENLRAKGMNVTKRIYDIFGQCDCDVVFLAIHGHVIRACFRQGGSRPQALAVNYIPNQKHPVYILSLITGVSLSDIKQTLLNPDDPEKYVVEMHRVMLNIGVAYGIGMGLLDVEPDSKVCSPVVRDLLMKLARIEYFPEETMDAACAVGGNGLAFSFYFLSAIANGGFKMGLSKQLATSLAAKTLQSACQCLLESNKHPSELQDSVTSSAGPSIYGLNVLEKTDCAAGFQSAVDAAYNRIKDLSDINFTGAAP